MLGFSLGFGAVLVVVTVDVDAASSTSMGSSTPSVLRDSMALVTLALESADVPELGENVSSFSVPPRAVNKLKVVTIVKHVVIKIWW